MIRRWLLIALATGLSLSLSVAQDTDVLIVEGNRSISARLHPYVQECVFSDCQRITDLLFPSLLNIDPETTWLTPSDDLDTLVVDWAIDEQNVTFTLADDRVWSDGQPITAYDVFFSYIAAQQSPRFVVRLREQVLAVAPLDDQRIQFVLTDATCRTVTDVNFPVVPAPKSFTESVDYAGGDIVAWFENFRIPRAEDLLINTPIYLTPEVTGGAFALVERQFQQSVDLVAEDETESYRFVTNNSVALVDFYLRGGSNLLMEPAYNRRADLRADVTSEIIEYAGNRSYFIALNPIERSPDGDILPHSILSDPVVREAMQLALDVDAIIDAAVEGNGVPLAASLPPTALGYGASLTPISQDVIAARRMLFDAGWRDSDVDGVRECVACSTAPIGTELRLNLDYPEFDPADTLATALLISRQLGEIGVSVSPTPTSSTAGLRQARFDMFLVNGFDVNDTLRTIGALAEIGDQTQITDQLRDADTAADCNVSERRTGYSRLETTLQADHTHLWLFSPARMLVTRVSRSPATQNWEDYLP